MINKIEVTRPQLYDEVWSEPISKLSKKYGLSDVGLAKVCKRNNIPRPPAGYWAKVASGHKVKNQPLPKMPDEKPIQFHISTKRISKEDPALSNEVETLIAFEKRAENRIIVPEKLLNPLPCITTVRDELLSSKTWRDGLLHTETSPQIWVTKPMIPRALLVMDTLLKALESRGYAPEGIFGEPFSFGLYEQLQSQRTDRAIAADHGWGKPKGYSASDYERIPSGKLRIEIITKYSFGINGLRCKWVDGKKKRIEDCLNDFICELITWAAFERDKKLANERLQRECEERERIAAEKARREAEKQARIDRLHRDASNWKRATQLRGYIAAAVEVNVLGKPDTELAEWAKWAQAEADRLDPLCHA